MGEMLKRIGQEAGDIVAKQRQVDAWWKRHGYAGTRTPGAFRRLKMLDHVEALEENGARLVQAQCAGAYARKVTERVTLPLAGSFAVDVAPPRACASGADCVAELLTTDKWGGQQYIHINAAGRLALIAALGGRLR